MMHTYDRLFGNGPKGLLLSLIALALSLWARHYLAWDLGLTPPMRWVALCLGTGATTLGVIYAVRSLPPKERGRKLCTTGAFRYVRHPLYASFLVCFNFGVAIWLNSWLTLIWAFALFPLWHKLMEREEALMHNVFPHQYANYKARTGRFLPRPNWHPKKASL